MSTVIFELLHSLEDVPIEMKLREQGIPYTHEDLVRVHHALAITLAAGPDSFASMPGGMSIILNGQLSAASGGQRRQPK